MKHPHAHLLTKCPSCGGPLVAVLDPSTNEELKICETCGFDSSADSDPDGEEEDEALKAHYLEKARVELFALQSAATQYARDKMRF